MTVYCYKCPVDGEPFTVDQRCDLLGCPSHNKVLIRDYKRENVGIGEGVRESRRELSNSGYRDLFLPTAADYMGPDDPDGQKGLRKWASEHGPREDNKRPIWPEMTKTQF